MDTETSIRAKLEAGFEPEHLAVINESSMHNVPKGSQTHFRVVVVAAEFESKPRLMRHRRVHRLLADELRAGVHALAIDALTPSEWEERGRAASVSPKCRGGLIPKSAQ